MPFTLGQRWISDTESELGLGTVVAVDARTVTLLFPSTGENRLYARSDSPVTRVMFNPGDTITSHDGWQMQVEEVKEENGLLTYIGTRLDTEESGVALREVFLDSKLVFSKPQDRLFAGQIDRMDRFALRYRARKYSSEQFRMPYSGLRGQRTSLIPHQLNIAHDVGRRHAPRVLLADEVGLGKTIEAGMILHQQLLSGAAERVLIIVPETLQHQWLVEMLRRFNLRFALFDDERYAEAQHDAYNPFDTEQLVICSLDFARRSKQRLEHLCEAEWDLLVVDEAHHLVWSEDAPSREYQAIEQLAEHVPGVLLLTATPEQLGMESRLRLLDPSRFHDFAQFVEEQKNYRPVADAVAMLLAGNKLSNDELNMLGEMIGELCSGHAYVNPGEIKGPERIPMGLLGAELSRDKSGFYRIDKILPGAIYSQKLRSPLTEPGIGVKEGDYITAIDGISTATVDNIYSLLAGKANVLTELSINRTASSKGVRKVVIKPLDNEYPLYHYNWVQNNIKKVEEATNGRVGYVYIPDMGPDGLNEFARYFYPQLDKEALIIDDRANGGGNVSPMIIERLLREPYRLTMRRGSTKIGTIPDATLVGPKVLLINKYSASDGDLFPWSFKANKIGKVIGTRTWGGIIGISGPLPYMDGTDVRVPFFTNYDAKTGQWIVENHGVDPDILIDNDPVKEQSGEDQQLNKAIEVILQELKDRKPLPSVPAPRTYKDLGVE